MSKLRLMGAALGALVLTGALGIFYQALAERLDASDGRIAAAAFDAAVPAAAAQGAH